MTQEKQLLEPSTEVEPAPDTAIAFQGVRQTFVSDGQEFVALDGVDLTVRKGEFLSAVGPSGCGKSTLLSLVAGTRRPTHGSVEIFGKAVRGVSTNVGFAFQRDALLPWKSALDNVALPLRIRGVGRKEARERAGEWLDRVGLAAFHDRYPHQLSGGMRKRVAIAVSLVYDPEILLMDEPFSALDVQTRNLMENDLLTLWAETGQTVLFITHDLEEAIALSDRVAVFSASPGRIVSEYEITLSRPRDLLDIRAEPAFASLYELIWNDLRSEVIQASGRSGLSSPSSTKE
jgi:NitT/TauT family transport system ATP-binding protein